MRKERQFLINGIMSKCKIINDLTSTYTFFRLLIQTILYRKKGAALIKAFFVQCKLILQKCK